MLVFAAGAGIFFSDRSLRKLTLSRKDRSSLGGRTVFGAVGTFVVADFCFVEVFVVAFGFTGTTLALGARAWVAALGDFVFCVVVA